MICAVLMRALWQSFLVKGCRAVQMSLFIRRKLLGNKEIDLHSTLPLEKISAIRYITNFRIRHLRRQFARIQALSTTPRKSRTLANLVEKLDALEFSINRLNRVRKFNRKNHRHPVGLGPKGQQEIYDATCTFYDAYYTYLNFLKGLVSEFQKIFPAVPHGTVEAFLKWVGTEFPHPLAYTYALKPARDIRSVLVHPNANSTINWETATNSDSEVYIIAKGLNSRGADVCHVVVDYPDGRGWYIPSPNERHVFLFTIDLTNWIFSTVLHAQNHSDLHTRNDWAKFQLSCSSGPWKEPDILGILISREFATRSDLDRFISNPVFE